MRHLKTGRFSSSVSLLALGIAMAGCGGGAESKAPSIDDDGLCTDIASLVCSNMYDCCSEGEIEAYLRVDEPRTEKECRRDVRLRCEDTFARQFWSVKEGRATSVEGIKDCLDALVPTDTCFELSETFPSDLACDVEFWRGAVAAGESCLFDYECVGDAYCANDQKCKVLPVAGEECSNRGCVEGSYCAFSPDNLCETYKTAGQDCVSTNECLEGLFCDTQDLTPSCKDLYASGETCRGNDQCSSSDCLRGTCATGGSSCYTDDDCSGRCEGTFQFCNGQNPCASVCSTNGNSCQDASLDCQTGETCDAPTCNLPECVGDVVCASEYLVIDYCELAQTIL